MLLAVVAIKLSQYVMMFFKQIMLSKGKRLSFFFPFFRLNIFIFLVFSMTSCQITSKPNGRRTGVKLSHNSITIISEYTNDNYQKNFKINNTQKVFDKIAHFKNDDINFYLFSEQDNCKANRQILIKNIGRLFPDKVFFTEKQFNINFYLLYQKNFTIKIAKNIADSLDFYFTIEQCNSQQTFDQLLSFVATLYHELTHIYLNNNTVSRHEEYLASKNALCANILTNNDVYMNFDLLKHYKNAQEAFENNPVYKNIYKTNDKLSILGKLDAHYELFSLVGESFSTQSTSKKKQIDMFCRYIINP